jgi:hypothetical protein
MLITHDVPLTTAPLAEVFDPWPRAQRELDWLAREPPPAPRTLRAHGRLDADLAERIADWFLAPAEAPDAAVRAAYAALEHETDQLWEVIRRGLGVDVRYVHADDDPYGAEALCADLRERRSMRLRTIACDDPHPLLDSSEGGVVDRLRVVHDVFGHAALGVGFDLQSEYATWLSCRTLFSPAARPAVFCELVAPVTTRVVTGERPALRADLPPAELLAACQAGRSA